MAKGGRTEKDIRDEIERRLKEIEIAKEQAQGSGLAFRALGRDELERKIKRAKSPYFYGMGWSSGLPRGATASFQAWCANPDPNSYWQVYVSIFFGVANFLPDLGIGLAGREALWPFLSSQPFFLSPGANGSPAFTYVVPAATEASTHHGNAILWRADPFDQGVYFDRAHFEVNAT